MLVPLAAIVLLAVLWSVFWYVVQGIARTEFDKARAAMAERGLALACGAEGWGGYPFRFEYHCQIPDLIESGTSRLRSTKLQAVALAYRPWHVIIFLQGETYVAPNNGPPLKVKHGDAVASIVAQSANSGTATLEVPNLNLNGILTTQHILLSARTSDMRQVTYAIAIDKLALNLPDLAPLLLDEIQSQGTITQDRTLVINSALARQGGLELSATGQLALDPERHPKGQLTLTTNDGPKLLDVITGTFHISEQERTALAAMLTVTGNQITLMANDGQLYAGPLWLGELAPIP